MTSRSAEPHVTTPTMPSKVVISQPSVPAAAFKRYAGRWVALHRGKIIASASSLQKLESNARVGRDDTRFRVPPKDSKFF